MTRPYRLRHTRPEIPGPGGFGTRLSKLRLQHRLTCKTLAEHMRVTPGMIRYYETGEGYPSFWVLLEIARYFNVDLNWLTGHTYDPRLQEKAA